MSHVDTARAAEEARFSSFHAVEIRCSNAACAAAKQARGKRYLPEEAPRLPLVRCARAGHCTCRYYHLNDRRQGPRRASESGLPAQLMLQSAERRGRVSRRAEDSGDTGMQPMLDTVDESYYDYVNKKLCE